MMSINRDMTEIKFIVQLNPTTQNIYLPDSIKSVVFEREKMNVAYTGGRIPVMALSFFSPTSNIESVTINYGLVQPTNASDSLRGGGFTSLKTIHLNVDTSKVTGWDRFLQYTTANTLHGVIIDGTPIDFSAMTAWNNVLNFDGLKEIRFVPNKIAVSRVSISNVYTEEYSDETWCSLVNALKAGQSGEFNIGSTAISRISAINGINSSGLFVLNSEGSMSLLDFATTIKGWTVV